MISVTEQAGTYAGGRPGGIESGMAEHIVKKSADLDYQTPLEFVGRSTGYSGDNFVDEPGGAVQMGFRVARLDP